MEIMQQTARAVASMLGRNSALIRGIRPMYEAILMSLHEGKGIPWEVNGVDYRIDAKERPRFAHNYEAQAAAFLAEHIKPGMTCFDVGANVGAYVLQLAHWSGPASKIVAFEPNTGAREVLARHIAWNGLKDRVIVVPSAVSSAPGESVLYAEGADGMSRLAEANRGLRGAAVEIVVPVTSLDAWCAANNMYPDVLLLDIEGFEIEALRGARGTIARTKPLIVVEMHPNVWRTSNASRQAVETLLVELRLRPVALSGQKDALEDHGQVWLEHL
jgi:FkbM family methyltransferase